jgi:DNA-binding HxlR family transcriptional regulator
MLYRAAIVDVRAWVGDRWSMWVLCALAEGGTLRFSALRDNIGNISQRMLAKTLRRLQQDGLVFRFVCSARPPRVDYALTPLGKSLAVRLEQLMRWAQQNQRCVLDARARGAKDEFRTRIRGLSEPERNAHTRTRRSSDFRACSPIAYENLS